MDTIDTDARAATPAATDGAVARLDHRSTGRSTARRAAQGTPAATFRLVRADDQLDVIAELFDVTVTGDQVAVTGTAPALRLTFGSQHTAETGFAAPDPVVPANAAGHIAAGASSVSALIAGDFTLSVDALLALAADGAGEDTAVELPTGLRLSPAAAARLVSATDPFTVAGTSEVWTAELQSSDPGTTLSLTATNVSPTDLIDGRQPDAEARDDIAANTALAPLTARRLALSSSGAFADLHGEWDAGLAVYDHRIRVGRDVRVETDRLGYLLPFGHRAAITTVSQRATVDDVDGVATSVMLVDRYLQIVEAAVASRPFAANDGNGLPFTSVTASADATQAITAVAVVDLEGAEIDGVFDIQVADGDLVVQYVTTDRAGSTASFAMPATFIDDSVAHGTGPDDAPARLRAVASDPARQARREVDLQGQRIAYAEPITAASPVSKATHAFTLSWEPPDAGASDDDLVDAQTPAIFAAVEHAEVVDDIVGAVSGTVGELIGVTLHPRWLEFGTGDGNFDQAFLTLDAPSTSRLGGDGIVNGVAQLDIVAEVFNQLTGTGPQRDDPDSPFDATDILGATARIIGNILLGAVIDLVEAQIPGTTIDIDTEAGTITTEFAYCPKLHDLDEVGFDATDETRCCVHLTATASLDDGVDASFVTELRVENFLLHFPPIPEPLVVVDFASVVGTVHSDGSSSVVPTIREWDFSGAISMLLSLVDALGFGNVDLKVRGELIDIDSTFNLPDVSLGVVELKNFNINLGLDLPLGDGQGELTVGIGSKSSPVDVEVMMFGGTFWLELGLGFNGLALPSSTISIGVSVYWEMLDFDIIVAHASFTLRLSADFRLQGDDVVFTGAVSLEGEVEILGLLSASASVVASLTYRSADERMVLRGTVNYCVDSFLGKLTSGTVPIGETTIDLGDGQPDTARASLRRRVAASTGGSPSFSDRYSEPQWDEYCTAFAA